MKLSLLVAFCLLGYVVSESCIGSGDCSMTSCGNGFDLHCLDGFCLCLSPATGASCNDSDECEHANHNHEHCQFSDKMVWKCVDNTCRCQKD